MEGRNFGTAPPRSACGALPSSSRSRPTSSTPSTSARSDSGVIDADILFLEQRQEDVSFLESSPLFQRLDAVRTGNVHFVGN